MSGYLYALYPDGEEKCKAATSTPVVSTPFIAPDGTVYTTAITGLVAIAPDCSQKWSLDLGSPLFAPVLGADGRIYLGSTAGYLHAINNRGIEEWKCPIDAIALAAPALDAQGNIYTGTTQGILFSVRPDGTIRWSYDTKEEIIASPAIGSDGSIYIGTINSLLAFTADGELKWSFKPASGMGFSSSPALGGQETLYAGGLDGFIYVLDANSGTLKSSFFTFSLPIVAPPVLDSNDNVFVGSSDIMNALSRTNTLLWKFTAQGSFSVAPAVGSNGSLYAVTQDGTLYAFGSAKTSFSIAGKLSGSIIEGTQIFITGADQRAVRVQPDGTYIVRGLAAGEYMVTPFMNNVLFDPLSKKITIVRQSITDADFTVKESRSFIISTSATPFQVANDGLASVLLTAEVYYPAGSQKSESVVVDLSSIGGSTEEKMHNTPIVAVAGKTPILRRADVQAGDEVYSLQTTVKPNTPLGLKALPVQLSDNTGVISRAAISVDVVSAINESAPAGSTKEYVIYNDSASHTLLIDYILTGQNTEAFGIAADCTSSLVILKPDKTPYFSGDLPITDALSHLEIRNAATGAWTYRVINSCASTNQYSITTNSSGTGIVSGIVADAITGEELDGVDIRTDGGGSTITEAGYYLLIQPAGVFTLTASDAIHSPSTQSVNIQAGGSVQINITLTPGSKGATQCPASYALDNEITHVQQLRTFRDLYLRGSVEGERYIKLYYQYAPELYTILKSDPELKQQIKKNIKNLLPLINGAKKQEPLTVNPEQKIAIKSCLEQLKVKARNGLRWEIDKFIKSLDENRIFTN